MKHAWPQVRLRDVLTQVQREESTLSGKVYRQIGVRLWGQGAYERESIDGSQTQYARLFQARSGDIVVNKIWARNGSVGVVSDVLDGTWGSAEFPLFTADLARLNPRWMHWITHAPWFWKACNEHAQGTSGKNRIKPEQFLRIEIPLPSLEIQKEMVSQIDLIHQKLQMAEKLRLAIVVEQQALCRSLIVNDPATKQELVGNLVRQRSLDIFVEPDVNYQFAGVYSFGKGVFKGKAKAGAEFAYPKLSRIKAGDFIYPKLMAWEGALGVVPEECDGFVVSPEFPVFEIDRSKVLPDIFDVHFRDASTWESLQGGSTGTNARRRRLNPTDFLKMRIPVPSMKTQKALEAVRLYQKRMQDIRVGEEGSVVLASLLNKMLK